MLSIIFLVLSVLSDVYFVLLNIASPGTFWGTVFSFSSVWLLLAVFFAALFVLEKCGILKKICGRISKTVKIIFAFFIFFGVFIAALNLFFICTPRLSDGNENVRYVILLGGGITKDAKLTDSVQNRVRVAAEYLKAHPDAVAVVTSDFHIARAQRLASRMGFQNVYGVASRTPSLFVLNSYCREICCYVKLNLRILLTGKPDSLVQTALL